MDETVDLEARYLAKQIDINTLHAILEPRPLEEQSIRDTTQEEPLRRDWRIAVQNWKYYHWKAHLWVPSEKYICNLIEKETEGPPLITDYVPDPRLHADNFRNTGKIAAYMEPNFPEWKRKRFLNFVYGCRVLNISLRPESADDFIIKKWGNCKEPELSLCITWGLYCFKKFQHQAVQRRALENHPSGPNEHWFIEGRPKQDATVGDIHEVNDFDNQEVDGIDPQPKRPEGARWVFEKTLYEAMAQPGTAKSQKIVHLFTLVSADDRILQRMIVKILGADDEDDILQRVIWREYGTHANLASTRCPHILDVYGCSIRNRQYSPTLGYIFMEYAEYGDLFDLLVYMRDNPDKQLPEPYIWLIFRSLLEAIFAMTCGSAVQKDLPLNSLGEGLEGCFPSNWQVLINPDIKPENVVLTKSDQDYYPGYLTAKMIDFGIVRTEDVWNGPRAKRIEIGTRGWGPPEHMTPRGDWNAKYDKTPIHVHSEIFNAAQVVFSLMEGIPRNVRTPERKKGRMDHTRTYRHCYSSRLERVVAQCLNWDPNLRPSLVNLLYRCKQGLEDWESAYGSVNKPEAEVPDFAKYKFNQHAGMLQIGEAASSDWKGMRLKKRTTAEVDDSLVSIKVKRQKNIHMPHRQPVAEPDGADNTTERPFRPSGLSESLRAAVQGVIPDFLRGKARAPVVPPKEQPKPGELGYLQSLAGMGGGVRPILVGSPVVHGP